MALSQEKQIVRTENSEFLQQNWDYLINLAIRWKDEKQYEDINDYKTAIEKNCGIKVIKMLKRPFGFSYIRNGVTLTIKYKFSGGYINVTTDMK